MQDDHSPDNVKFPVWFVALSMLSVTHARTGVTDSGGGRNVTVRDLQPYI